MIPSVCLARGSTPTPAPDAARFWKGDRKMDGSSLVDPKWFYVAFAAILVVVGGLMWWAGLLKKK
jgi:hypothetical protein